MISRDEFIKASLKPKSPTISDLAKPDGGFDITGEEVRELKKKYSKELEEIQNIRNVFNRKKGLKEKIDGKEYPLFRFNFEEFYNWYVKQDRVCAYCGTDEYILKDLFDNGILSSKRGSKRGRSLEIERKDSDSNVYSADNCILACYFCNNHKSDIISAEDHKKYFAEKIAQYLRDKHNESK